MPNFFTFDDGLTYHTTSDIDSFGYESAGDFEGGTWIKMKNGHIIRVRWMVEEVAKRLGPTANLHY